MFKPVDVDISSIDLDGLNNNASNNPSFDTVLDVHLSHRSVPAAQYCFP
jgi:hypothetical protein